MLQTITEVAGSVVVTMGALGILLGGVVVGYRKVMGNAGGAGGAFSAAAEHAHRQREIELLTEIRDLLKSQGYEAGTHHKIMMLRLDELLKETTRA